MISRMKLLARLLIAGFLLQTASLKKPANLRTPADSNLKQQLKASNDTAPLNPKSALPKTETQQAKNDSKPLNPKSALAETETPQAKNDSKPLNPKSALPETETPQAKNDSKPLNPKSALPETETPQAKNDSKPLNPKSALPETETPQAKNDSKPLNPKSTAKTSGSQEADSKKPLDGFLGPPQCLEKKYNRWSCAKVFCPPWMRCLSGECLCKIPYKCPKQEMQHVCGLDGTSYSSMCNAKATSCRSKEPVFSHFNNICKHNVKVTVTASNSHDVVQINIATGEMLVCGNHWDAAAANVVCRDRDQNPRGAKVATKVRYDSLANNINWPSQCVSVQCTGSELSLAECTIYKPKPLMNNTEVAVLKCYKEPTGECRSFLCVNGKCLAHEKTCNGVDDCGDNSDEMCCQGCRGQAAFHCSSGVCIPSHAVRDGIRDCLGGEDEQEDLKKTDNLLSDPKSEIRDIRTAAENQLQCGIPNMEYVHRPEDTTPPGRQKRLVGGEEALPTQIQWQVAVQEERSIHCGGAYIGGCWVLTAAHCVRNKPKSFRIKFSLWKKHRKLSTTDTIPVKNIIIHHQYNPQTYENDIALIQLQELNLLGKCMHENPAVRSVCVPWSTEQFQPNHTCTISGWGRNKEGKATATLKWANVTLIGNCEDYYKKRFLPGMECAGDLEGNVDSCQGDSGGPLVCKDASGVSYVWGIVSWGDKCGEANHPGVYTKVAHYFEWIRFHAGWPAVTKYNQ